MFNKNFLSKVFKKYFGSEFKKITLKEVSDQVNTWDEKKQNKFFAELENRKVVSSPVE